MNLENDRKILKITGIISIIGAVLTCIIGILNLIGVFAGGESAAVVGMIQKKAMKYIILGIVTIISAICYLVQGIASIKASKQNKYGTKAIIWAIISMMISICRAWSEIRCYEWTIPTITGLVITISIVGLIYFEAKKVKEAYREEKNK